jgi:hypothetical protein
MFHLIQLYKLIDNKKLFIELFDDLSYEINELGYEFIDDQMELVNEMLFNHFGLEIDSPTQLQRVTETILRKQGSLRFLEMI